MWYTVEVSTESPSRPPAPGRLALVQAFLNSIDLETGDDELATPSGATAWLATHGGRAVSGEAERGRLVQVREGLRAVLEAQDDAAAQFTALLGASPLRVEVGPDGARLLAAGEGVDAFLGEVAAAVVEATLLGTWGRLKVCRSSTCRFAFYDSSKNGCGTWCTMRVCGAREKARTYRRRRSAAAG